MSAVSTSFMNPTKSAVHRQKSSTKKKVTIDPYGMNSSIESVKTEEKNKSSMARIGELRIREKPLKRVLDFENRKYSYNMNSGLKERKTMYRISRIRDISTLVLESHLKQNKECLSAKPKFAKQ